MNDVLIFANPISGRGRGLVIARRVEGRLKADGLAAHVFFDRADLIAPDAIPAGAKAAVVIGGDGTLRAVVERLTQQSSDVPPILPIGLGTANLMVRHLGLRWDDLTMESQVSDAIAGRQVSMMDAGLANGKLFLLMAGVGFDGHVVHTLDSIRSGPINPLSYIEPLAVALGQYDFQPLRITVDGHEAWPPRRGLAFIGNVKEYGTMFPIIPHARPDDGLLDVCLLPCESRYDLVRLFLHAAGGEHVLGEGAVYVRGKTICVESERPIPVQIDGDPAGHTPLDIGLLPFRLPFIVP